MGNDVETNEFDGFALFQALDAQRDARGLSWTGVARQMWELSADLNARRGGRPISPSTITGVSRRGDTSCQHALVMLRWLERSPESFLAGSPPAAAAALPAAGPDCRLRWNLHESPQRPVPGLYKAMNGRRERERLTWRELACACGAARTSSAGCARRATRSR
jgi:hypothetical protein